MDARSFDALARALTEPRTRRGLLGMLALVPMQFATVTPPDEVTAGDRRKHRKHGDHKRRKARQPDPELCGGQRCNPRTQVCDNGVCMPCTVCGSGCKYEDLQHAVDLSRDGDIIYVCAGSYRGSFHFHRRLTIIGTGWGAWPGPTVLQGGVSSLSAVLVSHDVTLRNLMITGAKAGDRGAGIEVFQGALTLIEVLVKGNQGTVAGGIRIDRWSTVWLRPGTLVTGNVATAGDGAGGIRNQGHLKMLGGVISDNQPSNCVNVEGGSGCPTG